MHIHPVMEKLREERIRQGLSLAALGEKAGYEANHIWNLEMGKCRAKIDIVSDIAQALGMTLEVRSEHRATEL